MGSPRYIREARCRAAHIDPGVRRVLTTEDEEIDGVHELSDLSVSAFRHIGGCVNLGDPERLLN